MWRATYVLCFAVVTTGSLPGQKAPDPKRPFQLPPGVSLDGSLTAGDAVRIALLNNSTLEFDRSALGIAQADVLDAGLLKNPNVSSLIPVGSKPFEFLLNWPIEDLWQRKKRVLAAQQNLEAVTTGLIQNGLNLIRDVRVAHADLWVAESRSRTLAESAKLRARIATLTERRRDAGDATGLDVGLARADANSTSELAIRAAGDVEIAQSRLRLLLGMRNDPRPLSAKLDQEPPQPAPVAQLVEAAYASRPDLRAAELAVEANAYRAKWQRSRVLNMVVPMLSVKESGSPVATRAGPGFQIEIPLFNRNQGQIARADAEVVQSAWRYAALRDRVEQEVRESFARFQQSRTSLDQLRRELKPAVEQVIEQTGTALRNGDASLLNLLEATRQRYDAELRESDAEAALMRAYAEVERSVGKKP